MENKKIKFFFISLVCLLIIIFGLKQIWGYSPIGYLFNAYYNFSHNSKIIENTYKIEVPFFTWRISEKENNQIVVSGMLTKDGFLKATFNNNALSKSFDEIKKMCTDENTIEKNITIGTYKAIDIYCENKSSNKLKSYRIIFIPKKIFVFMYKYQKNYNKQYEKLISKITILDDY